MSAQILSNLSSTNLENWNVQQIQFKKLYSNKLMEDVCSSATYTVEDNPHFCFTY